MTSMDSIREAVSQQGIRFDPMDERILTHLRECKCATATEVQKAIGAISRTTVFYRLLTLRAEGIVTSHRTSRNTVVYALSDEVDNE